MRERTRGTRRGGWSGGARVALALPVLGERPFFSQINALDTSAASATIKPNLGNQTCDWVALLVGKGCKQPVVSPPNRPMAPMTPGHAPLCPDHTGPNQPTETTNFGHHRMARPPAKELTQRELEVMHFFWSRGEATAAEARDGLAAEGVDRAYTTIATLIRIVTEKGFLKLTNDERPFTYRPARSFDDVARRLVDDVVKRVFRGSREELLVQLLARTKLSAKERDTLKRILREQKP